MAIGSSQKQRTDRTIAIQRPNDLVHEICDAHHTSCEWLFSRSGFFARSRLLLARLAITLLLLRPTFFSLKFFSRVCVVPPMTLSLSDSSSYRLDSWSSSDCEKLTSNAKSPESAIEREWKREYVRKKKKFVKRCQSNTYGCGMAYGCDDGKVTNDSSNNINNDRAQRT